MIMPYALMALGYFLGVPGGRFPSDCMRTCVQPRVSSAIVTNCHHPVMLDLQPNACQARLEMVLKVCHTLRSAG